MRSHPPTPWSGAGAWGGLPSAVCRAPGMQHRGFRLLLREPERGQWGNSCFILSEPWEGSGLRGP